MRFLSGALLCVAVILPWHVRAEDTTQCVPACRSGYFCLEGECISRCNPPCLAGERCTGEGECVLVAQSGDVANETPKKKVYRPRVAHEILCNPIMVVRPDFLGDVIPGNVDEDVLIKAANMVAQAVVHKTKLAKTIIDASEIETVRASCASSALVVVKLQSYTKKPAMMGQYTGTIVIVIETYDPINQAKPTSVLAYGATGSRHWGDTVPLENAIESLCGHVRRNFKLGL